MKNKFLYILIAILLLTFQTLALAENRDKPSANEGYQEGYQNTMIPLNQTVENVLLIGRDGVIAGKVKDEVIVINGNLLIKNTARISDRVLIIGGHLKQENDAKIGKGIINISTSSFTLNSILIGVTAFLGLEFVKLLISILLIIGTMTLVFIAPNLSERSVKQFNSGLLKIILVGFLGLIIFLLISLALVSTIWGIPIVIIFSLVLLVMIIQGFTGISLYIGEFLFSNWKPKFSPKALTAGVGSFTLIAFLNLPVIGVLWGVFVTILALGINIVNLTTNKNK